MIKAKEITLPTWVQIILVGALISSGGLLFAQVNQELSKKANNETIMKAIDSMQEQRKEDKIDLKEQRREQQETNKQLYQSIQQILINMEKKADANN